MLTIYSMGHMKEELPFRKIHLFQQKIIKLILRVNREKNMS